MSSKQTDALVLLYEVANRSTRDGSSIKRGSLGIKGRVSR